MQVRRIRRTTSSPDLKALGGVVLIATLLFALTIVTGRAVGATSWGWLVWGFYLLLWTVYLFWMITIIALILGLARKWRGDVR